MLNRRQFLGTGLGATVAALALPGDKIRYAMSGHQFRLMPPHPEAGVKMTAQYGYHGLEPFQEDIAKYLDKPPEALKQVLAASGLDLCTVGSGGQYLDPPPFRRRWKAISPDAATSHSSVANTSK